MPDVLEIHDAAKRREGAELDTQPQHMAALAKGNAIRLEKAAVKRKLSEGEWNLMQAFLHPPPSARLGEILMSARGLGPERVRVMLMRLGMGERKRLDTLTRRQKQAIYAYLVENHPTAWGAKAGEFPAAAGEIRCFCSRCGDELREGRSTCGTCARERIA